VALLRRHNVDAVLIGEALMREADRPAALARLMKGEGDDKN
jgi:indole-3-glycerol phosphate synthase